MNRYAQNVLMTLAAILAANAALHAQRPVGAADNVILITLDGARVQEMFGGLDLEILRSTLKKGQTVEDQPVYRRFWAEEAERLLDAYARTDGYLKRLWTWLESQPDYRGRTHLLITTDHGRGRTRADWRDHGETIAGAEDVWIAFVSPSMSRRGEWKNQPGLFTNQIAATVARWLGVDWHEVRPNAGKPIQ